MVGMLRTFNELVVRRLRLSEPWNFKAPFLITVPYFFIHVGGMSPLQGLTSVVWSLCTIVGIAGFGYFCNDLSDREADRQAGKPNGTLALGSLQIVVIFAFFLVAALVPWVVYFPVDRLTVLLLCAQFLCFIAYSIPPVRLKERGILGLFADGLYAHAIPALLAAHTFHQLTEYRYEHIVPFLIALASWQFVVGVRSILQHQILDADNDRAAGTRTYATSRGETASLSLTKYVLVPLEVICFVAYTGIVALAIPVMAIAWPVYLVIAACIIRFHWQEELFARLHDRVFFFLDSFYLRWMPLVLLGAQCMTAPGMVILLVLHLAIFENGVSPALRRAVRHVVSVLR